MIRVLMILGLLAFSAPAATAQSAGPFAAFDAASDQVLSNPHGIIFGPDGMLYISDLGNNRVTVMDPDGRMTGVIGYAAGMGPGAFRTPEGVAIRGDVLYFSDSGNDRIVRYRVVIN